MKHYVIYLPEYANSVAMAKQAVDTGHELGWAVELWAGVDGSKVEWPIKTNQDDAKCRAMMQRAGVRGCFLSHWYLWNHCAETDQSIGIFEHDIVFQKPPPKDPVFEHVLKLEGFLLKKSRPAGQWYEGARAYLLRPAGAKKLIAWVNENGALPADVNIGLDVVDIVLDTEQRIVPHELYGKTHKREQSFTWNLEGMK